MSVDAPWEDYQGSVATAAPPTAPSPAPQGPTAPSDASKPESGPWDAYKAPAAPATISEPPAPQSTTFLSDKNVVVGHPTDMSHDQVNDAIQTTVYGRPRHDFHTEAPPAPSHLADAFNKTMAVMMPGTLPLDVLPESAKGVLRGAEGIGKGLAGLAKWFGDAMQAPGVDATGKPLPEGQDVLSESFRKIGSVFSDVSQKAIDFLDERQTKGFEAPDPEIFRGSFVSNPSFARLAATVAQGLPMLGAAAAVTVATGNPNAGAGAMGLMGVVEQYDASKEAGQSTGQASVAAGASAIGNTLLMMLPLHDFLEGFGATGVKAVVKGGAEVAGISAIQTPFNNIIAKMGGDKGRQILDGMAESILAGAVSGGVLAGFSPGRGAEIDGLIQEAHKAGVPAKDIDAARAEIAKQMVENPDAVTSAIQQEQVNVQQRGNRIGAETILQNKPDLQPSYDSVYADAKAKIDAAHPVVGLNETDWGLYKENFAKVVADRTLVAAEKRGQTVEDAYANTLKTIQNTVDATTPPDALKQNPPVAPIWYSAVEKTLEEKMSPKASGDQIIGLLKNAPGVKQEELDALGLPEFLKMQGKSVDKQAVLDFVKQGGVKVEEVVKGDERQKMSKRLDELDAIIADSDTSTEQAEAATAEYQRLNEEYKARYERTGLSIDADTKFSEYTLPGGENYREVLLTLPDQKQEAQRIFQNAIADGMSLIDAQDLAREQFPRFTSSHFSEPNVLAHVRFNERTDAEGKRVLFIEEVQSDWHQKGREKGYQSGDLESLKNQESEAKAAMSDARGFALREISGDYLGYDTPQKALNDLSSEADKAAEWMDRHDVPAESRPVLQKYADSVSAWTRSADRLNAVNDGVPDAPFKKTWHELALKRIIRYAAENGFDKIAWTTGEQQAERYDLSKQVSTVLARKQSDGRFTLAYVPKGMEAAVEADGADYTVVPGTFSKEELAGQIGKDLAGKITALADQRADNFPLEFSGLDLKVGGEGMKGFYDQIIPSFLNKYAKKWGGRVGETALPGIGREPLNDKPGGIREIVSAKVHSLDITPDMKKSVMEVGQPLFQGEGTPQGSVHFTKEGAVISLLKTANASTVFHEISHVWLKDDFDFVKSGKAGADVLADWQLTSEWLGVSKDQTELTRGQQEKFARSFEAYLREGVAPTPGLKGVFENLKKWMLDVYHTAKTLKADMTPEVRRIMDNLLSMEQKAPSQDIAIPFEGKYVKNRPFDIQLGANDKETATDIREQFSGIKNEQIIRGNQLRDEIVRDTTKAEREGMFWYKAAQGDLNVLADALNNPKLADYHAQIEAALKLSPKAIEALGKIDQYYVEAGKVSQDIGTISTVRENYQNRIYEPRPPSDFVKTERAGIKQTTSHAKQRVFDTEFQAAEAGMKFATTDVADALSIHNEEMARVNTARRMGYALVQQGLIGAWAGKTIPEGWEPISMGGTKREVPVLDAEGKPVIDQEGNPATSTKQLIAPKGIVKGLRAIADGSLISKIEELSTIQKYQGLIKTINLSFSGFHHFTMAGQILYQGGVRTLLHLPVMNGILESPDFAIGEQDMALHTGMTSKIEDNQDILRNLTKTNDDMFSKITNLPGVKQVLKTADAGGEFLFGKVQRYLKVSDYMRKVSNWIADNQDATNAEIRKAKIGFAEEVNAAYGGLNWGAMGVTKTHLSLLRLALLAPDWTISNVKLLQYAVGDWGKTGTAGKASRAHLITALVGGMVLTEGLNKMFTGHFTDENDKGHFFEIEISPGVYVSLLRGGIGDIVKLGSMVVESGPVAGGIRYAQGKMAPVPRTAMGALENVQYTGAAITHKDRGPILGTYDYMKFILSNTLPVPFGVSNFAQYMNDSEKTILGGVAVATGLGRYSRPKSRTTGRGIKL